jgi:hypothetical protein
MSLAMRFKMAWRDGDVLTVDGGGCEFGYAMIWAKSLVGCVYHS